MRNKFFICTLLLIFSIDLFSQKFISRNSQVNFNASTILEEIRAINNNVSCILDTENGNVAIQMKMISFKFKKALMEEHFNEKYVESEKYPNSNFVGEILNWDKSLLNGDMHNIICKGRITIHGVSKSIETQSTIQKINKKIIIISNFTLANSDFNIKIPKLVKDKISETVEVNLNIQLLEKK